MNQQLNEYLELFKKFNTVKYKRFQSFAPPAALRIINLLPCLLCVNHPRLPGYVQGETPLGITGFSVDDETKKLFRAKFPAVTFEPKCEHPFIEMMAIMGSVGTIAYNKKSDFDYWVCVQKASVSAEQNERFREKVLLIQKWAEAESGLPVHIFINDAERLRKNMFDEDEEEAFGNTVGPVLKDEFFRSSIIIAGKVPFWWAVPVGASDEEYDVYYNELSDDEKQNIFINLGNLRTIKREDFMGAALFQIIKSLGNPFKSIIKLGVLEKYIFDGNEPLLISNTLKASVQQSEEKNDVYDSYLLMFNHVYEYYKKSGMQPELLDILTKNLYLKIDSQLSRYAGVKDKKNIPYKVEVMSSYAASWGWNEQQIKDMDAFDAWDFNKVMRFWDAVRVFMLTSYQKISAVIPSVAAQKISENDFTLISRKIKTHFSKAPDKIEQFITFKDTTYETMLYLDKIQAADGNAQWRFYKKIAISNYRITITSEEVTIKTDSNLVKLIAWAALNKVYDPQFSRIVQSPSLPANIQNAVTKLLTDIGAFFTDERMHVTNEYFVRDAHIVAHFIVINFGDDVSPEIKTIHHIYCTSWGELFVKAYAGEQSLIQILKPVVSDGFIFKRNLSDYLEITAPDPYKKNLRAAISLFKDAYTFLIEKRETMYARYAARLGTSYFAATRTAEGIVLHEYPNFVKLTASLALKPLTDMRCRAFAENDSMLTMLSIAENAVNKKTIRILYQEIAQYLMCAIVNETGNVFLFIKPNRQKELILGTACVFAQNAVAHVNAIFKTGLNSDAVSILALRQDRFGKPSLVDETKAIMEQFFARHTMRDALSVSINRSMGEEYFYNIHFPDKVESELMTIREIYSVNEKIQSMRRMGDTAYNLVYDIKFGESLREDEPMGTGFYFAEKYKLEFMLDKYVK